MEYCHTAGCVPGLAAMPILGRKGDFLTPEIHCLQQPIPNLHSPAICAVATAHRRQAIYINNYQKHRDK